MVRLKADRLEKSTVSCGRLFHTLTTRSAKNVDLEVQLQWRFSILYGCPRVTLASLKSKKSETKKLMHNVVLINKTVEK